MSFEIIDKVINLKSANENLLIQDGKAFAYSDCAIACENSPTSINCNPNAKKLVKVVDIIDGVATFALTKTGNLSIKNKSITASVKCSKIQLPSVKTEGNYFIDIDFVEFKKAISNYLKLNKSFDYIYIDNENVYYSNGTLLVKHHVKGLSFGLEIILSKEQIKLLTSIDLDITCLQVCGNNITVYYSQSCWIQLKLLDITPKDFKRVIKKFNFNDNGFYEFDKSVYDDVNKIKSFIETDFIYIEKGRLLSGLGTNIIIIENNNVTFDKTIKYDDLSFALMLCNKFKTDINATLLGISDNIQLVLVGAKR